MLRVLLALFSQILKLNETLKCVTKIRDVKGRFHAKMGTIEERNSMHLTKAEEIKERWQEYTEELY